ncbi:MAG: CHAT domain-containing protein, partial [Promethearchaeota archaeon]
SGFHLSDIKLTAKSINQNLNYVPEIIFLNACESAQTIKFDLKKGQVSGLAESFIHAGAKTFIGSLWPIDDKVASLFAHSFYQNLLQENKTVGESVLSSKNELFNLKSPYGWGSFLLFGSPNIVPFSFKSEIKDDVERAILQPIQQPFQLRSKKDEKLLQEIVISQELKGKLVPIGIEDELIRKIEREEFNVILGPTGIGKTNCKYILTENDLGIKFYEIKKKYLKGINNSELILRIREELKDLAGKHRIISLVLDEEHNTSLGLTGSHLLEIAINIFDSGKPSSLKENLRVILFLRTKSFNELNKAGLIAGHWRMEKTWLEGIRLTDESMEKLLSIHNLSKTNFSLPAYENLIQRLTSRDWIHPLIADNLLYYLEKNLKEQFSSDDIESIKISDDIVETIKNLVFKIRSEEEQNVWKCIVQLNGTFGLNPPLWLIKTAMKNLNYDTTVLAESISNIVRDRLLIEEKHETFTSKGGIFRESDSHVYLFSHDIYYDVIIPKEIDEDIAEKLTDKIKEELNNNLEKLENTKIEKRVKSYLKNLLQRFYFLAATEYIDDTKYIDKVLNCLNGIDTKILQMIIPDLERLVYDFYARNNIKSISKLYIFLGDYYSKNNDLSNATDFYNLGCHILETLKEDSSEYRIKNGNLYDKIISEIMSQNKMNQLESQVKVELAAWQWKASKQYEKGIQIRKLLVDEFMKTNKFWAAADLKWCAEVAELDGKTKDAIKYYKEAISLLEGNEKHIFNMKDTNIEIRNLLKKLSRDGEIEEISSIIAGYDAKISKMGKPGEKTKIFMICGIGDMFVGNQIHHKILQEIPADVTIMEAAPSENYDILILFGAPLTPIVGHLLYKFLDRGTISEILSSSGYWIKKPSHEGEPLIIAIAGYTMFDTRREAEKFVAEENFQDLIKLI